MGLKIAINQLGGKGWTGGITYRNNLVKAILECKKDVELVLLVDSLNEKEEIDPRVKRIAIKRSKNPIDKLIGKILKHLFDYDLNLSRTAKYAQADVVFPTSSFISKKIGRIFWYPDFQFLHLPHMYEKGQLKNMGPKLLKRFKNASIVLLSSLDAQKDFKKFSPEYLLKTRVMNFVAHVPEKLLQADCLEVVAKYHLPESFIYLPNQLWAHKNHLLVLEAMSEVVRKDHPISLVITGNLTDRRNPSYINDFFLKLASSGIHNHVFCLGMIPHDHVYALIRQSRFVLNPSLFEGWSTTVEETKSVGKRMLLSDLDVHKEQNPPNSNYFMVNDSKDLALQMIKMWNETKAGPDIEMENLASSELNHRMDTFANRFIEICLEAKALAK